MKQLEREAVSDLVVNILERIAFLFTDPCDDTSPLECRGFAHISFNSESDEGDVYLAAEDSFLAELAGSMLGMEPEELDIDVEGVQALDELANIVGGEVILAIGGSETPYELSLPSRMEAFPDPKENESSVVCRFEGESGCLDLMIRRSEN